MLLESFQDPVTARAAADEAYALAGRLFPICRSITGNGVRATLDLVETVVSLTRSEVPSGTAVFDWEVPREWNIRDAYIADASGRRVVDFRQHNLHVVNYSAPVRRTMSLDELQPHLHSMPEKPDWIPYRTSYYRETWGFCLRHADRERMQPGPYEVVVDSTLADGHLTYAECVVPGSGPGEAIVYTHTCHPSLANDNLSGLSLVSVLAREVSRRSPRRTWRFVFGPGTIGSLTWLSRNESILPGVRGGLVVGLLGDRGALTYKRSRRGDTPTDRAAEVVLRDAGADARLVDFEPYGYDERQFCSPGFDLPIGRLTRSPNGAYPEYHSSADDLAFLDVDRLAESLQVLSNLVGAIDANRFLLNLSPKGEPRLGKRGLYGMVGGTSPGAFEHALLWVLSLADGQTDLVTMARRAKLPLVLLDEAALALEQAGLLQAADQPIGRPIR
ncbi:MAG: hypothetical protein K0Q76_3749 [Panacagrimonas sp.]|jgi:aminopeptidase-like protein|nr:DUF4910 domain-containing protein [Panacagrimonas sp.]MCC2658641.1 hypothetical protein [Panacagrimonas sp.]